MFFTAKMNGVGDVGKSIYHGKDRKKLYMKVLRTIYDISVFFAVELFLGKIFCSLRK